MNARRCLIAGAILGMLGVILGAFGAHLLKSQLAKTDMSAAEQLSNLRNWETGVRYQLLHAVALLIVGVLDLVVQQPRPGLKIAGNLFAAGILIFSGCLYVLVIFQLKVLGMFVPIGGASLIGGWIALLVVAIRAPLLGNQSGSLPSS